MIFGSLSARDDASGANDRPSETVANQSSKFLVTGVIMISESEVELR
jgi:hypothetical protein